MDTFIETKLKEYKGVLRAIPGLVTALFIMSCILMNLLANKELYRSDYICINSGLVLSWVSFLCMDTVCKRFGAKAAIELNIVAMTINILAAIMFKVCTLFPGHWAMYFSAPDPITGEYINSSLNATFGGTWYVVVGSATAMLVSGIINSLLNAKIGEASDDGTFKGFAIRSYISTMVAQWFDNFIFSAMVSHVFFGWNWTQVICCATTSMIFELVIEAVFSPIGYRISKNWENEHVGEDYLKRLKGDVDETRKIIRVRARKASK